MIRLRTALNEGAAEMAALPNPPGRIAGIVVSAVRQGEKLYDLFEVYGTFPSPPQNASEISLTCNGEGVDQPQSRVGCRQSEPGQLPDRPLQRAGLGTCSVKFPVTGRTARRNCGPENVRSQSVGRACQAPRALRQPPRALASTGFRSADRCDQ